MNPRTRSASTVAALALCITAFAFSAVSAVAEDFADKLVAPGKLTIGTTGSSPPSTMYDEDAELVGIDIDLATKIAGDLGLEPEFVVLDWSGMLAGVQAGRFDMVASSVSRTPERVASADFFVTQAYIANGTAAAMHADNTEIKGWADICGKRIGIVKGAAQIRNVVEKFGEDCVGTPQEYPGWTELLLDLRNKRIDVLVGNYITPAYLIKSTNRPLKMLEEPLAVGGNALVIQPGNEALAMKIDELLTGYREDGSLNAIAETWVGKALDLSTVAQ